MREALFGLCDRQLVASEGGTQLNTPTTISTSAAVELAHAMVSSLASSLGVRALLIKGPVASMFGLRAPRVSADVDVLVEQRDVEALCQVLIERGWHPPVQREVPLVLDRHSMTLVHDRWPCAIDVHWEFPGMLCGSTEAFDALWETRTAVVLANRSVLVPSRAGMALFVALHAWRRPSDPRSRVELPGLVEVVRRDFTRAERAELLSLATLARSRWILGEFLRDCMQAPLIDDASLDEKRAWEFNQATGADKTTLLWQGEAATALKNRQWKRLWRIVWVRREDVPRSLVSQLPTRREHWRYQVERWMRGARAIAQCGKGEPPRGVRRLH